MAPAAPYPAPSAELLQRIDAREARLGADVEVQAKLDWLNAVHGTLREDEARVIARETGQTLQQPGPGYSLQPQWSGDDFGLIAPEEFAREAQRVRGFQEEVGQRHRGQACPFLAGDAAGGAGSGRCTIYGSRPLVCRQLVNLDRDALLCHLVPGREVRVPYLDVRQHAAVQMAVLGIGQRLADIRSWFRAPDRSEATAVVVQARRSAEASS